MRHKPYGIPLSRVLSQDQRIKRPPWFMLRVPPFRNLHLPSFRA